MLVKYSLINKLSPKTSSINLSLLVVWNYRVMF